MAKTKSCKDCGRRRKLTEFACRFRAGKSEDDPSNYASYCKPCMAIRSKAHYSQFKNRYAARNTATRERKYQILLEYKERPCADCGGEFPACAMDFDHRPGQAKTKPVSALLVNNASVETLMKEIAKCDVVCAVCHRIRTWITRR